MDNRGEYKREMERMSGIRGCDLVTGTTEFIGRNGLIFCIRSNADSSRIISYRLPNSTSQTTGFTYGSVKRVDTVTITGTAGTATMTCDALAKTLTFNGNIATTISDFVTANVAAYLVTGQVLTGNATQLIFTSSVAGTDYTGSTAVSAPSNDLAGTVVITVANVTANIDNNKDIWFYEPVESITLGAGSFWAYYC